MRNLQLRAVHRLSFLLLHHDHCLSFKLRHQEELKFYLLSPKTCGRFFKMSVARFLQTWSEQLRAIMPLNSSDCLKSSLKSPHIHWLFGEAGGTVWSVILRLNCERRRLGGSKLHQHFPVLHQLLPLQVRYNYHFPPWKLPPPMLTHVL